MDKMLALLGEANEEGEFPSKSLKYDWRTQTETPLKKFAPLIAAGLVEVSSGGRYRDRLVLTEAGRAARAELDTEAARLARGIPLTEVPARFKKLRIKVDPSLEKWRVSVDGRWYSNGFTAYLGRPPSGPVSDKKFDISNVTPTDVTEISAVAFSAAPKYESYGEILPLVWFSHGLPVDFTYYNHAASRYKDLTFWRTAAEGGPVLVKSKGEDVALIMPLRASEPEGVRELRNLASAPAAVKETGQNPTGRRRRYQSWQDVPTFAVGQRVVVGKLPGVIHAKPWVGDPGDPDPGYVEGGIPGQYQIYFDNGRVRWVWPSDITLERENPGQDKWAIGQRIQLHPGTDAWARGDRYGTVVKMGRPKGGMKVYHVKMDRSGRTLKVREDLMTWENPPDHIAVHGKPFKENPGEPVIWENPHGLPDTGHVPIETLPDGARVRAVFYEATYGSLVGEKDDQRRVLYISTDPRNVYTVGKLTQLTHQNSVPVREARRHARRGGKPPKNVYLPLTTEVPSIPNMGIPVARP